MNAHKLDKEGNILNTIVVESLDVFPDLVDASIGGTIGDKIVEGKLVKVEREPSVAQLMAELMALDLASIRPLREGDTEFLATITAKAVETRAKLRSKQP